MITYKSLREIVLRNWGLYYGGKRIADVLRRAVSQRRERKSKHKNTFFFFNSDYLDFFVLYTYLYFLNLIFCCCSGAKKKFMLLFREIFQKPTPYLLLSFLEFFQDVSNLELNFLFCSPIRRICEWRKSTVFCFLCLRFWYFSLFLIVGFLNCHD